MPKSSQDKLYACHQSFLHIYIDLGNAIRFEDGPHVIRHWQQWLIYFLACDKNNYASEAANLICKLKVDHLAIHNRTVNTGSGETQMNIIICKYELFVELNNKYRIGLWSRPWRKAVQMLTWKTSHWVSRCVQISWVSVWSNTIYSTHHCWCYRWYQQDG